MTETDYRLLIEKIERLEARVEKLESGNGCLVCAIVIVIIGFLM